MTATEANKVKPSLLVRVMGWLISLLTPVALILAVVRLVLGPYYVQLEYQAPGFPVDRYGFSAQERLHWAQLSREYLLNSADISYLADLHFDNGQPIYNERELKHMVDVKNTVQAALKAWYVTLAALIGLGLWARLGGWWAEYKRALGRGGWITSILVGVILAFVLVSFGVIFVAFHNVFFQAGTWTFNFTDTLIRLFPERFWRDIFLVVGGLTLAGGLALGFSLGRRRRV